MGQPSFIEITLLNSEASHGSKTKIYQWVPRTSASSPYSTPSVFSLGGSGKKTLSTWVSGLSGELFLGYRASWEVMGANCMEGDKPWDLLSHCSEPLTPIHKPPLLAISFGGGGDGDRRSQLPLLWTKQ